MSLRLSCLTIHLLTWVILFGWFVDNLVSQHRCFCNCCAQKPCALTIQDKILVDQCDACEPSCRIDFFECQSSEKDGKVFGLCSTSVSQQGEWGKNDYVTVKAADALLGTTEDRTTLEQQLNELRASYEEKVKAGTTDDQIPTGEHLVQTSIGDEISALKSTDEDEEEEDTVEEEETDEDGTTTELVVSGKAPAVEEEIVVEDEAIMNETDSLSSVVPQTNTDMKEKVDDNTGSKINDATLSSVPLIMTDDQTTVKSFIDTSATSTLFLQITTDTKENTVLDQLHQSLVEQEEKSELEATSQATVLPISSVIMTSESPIVSDINHPPTTETFLDITTEQHTINPIPDDTFPTATSTSSQTSQAVESDTVQTTSIEKQTASLNVAEFVETNPSVIETTSKDTKKQPTITIDEIVPIFDIDSPSDNSTLPSSTTQSTGNEQNVQINQGDTGVTKSHIPSPTRVQSNSLISLPTGTLIFSIVIILLIFANEQ